MKAERVHLSVHMKLDTRQDQGRQHLNYVIQRISPLVVQYIGELRQEIQEKYQVDLGRHLGELAKLRDDAMKKGAWSAAINAEVARGKAGGLYVDQKLILSGNLDNMSEKELEAKMAKILDDHKGLINVSPEESQPKSETEQLPVSD